MMRNFFSPTTSDNAVHHVSDLQDPRENTFLSRRSTDQCHPTDVWVVDATMDYAMIVMMTHIRRLPGCTIRQVFVSVLVELKRRLCMGTLSYVEYRTYH